MGNDQLFPAYHVQTVFCDEYITMIDVKLFAPGQDCFVPLTKKSNESMKVFYFSYSLKNNMNRCILNQI